jgi:hypothetical protein
MRRRRPREPIPDFMQSSPSRLGHRKLDDEELPEMLEAMVDYGYELANDDRAAAGSRGGRNKSDRHAEAAREAEEFERFRSSRPQLSRNACARRYQTRDGRPAGRALLRRVAAAKKRARQAR